MSENIFTELYNRILSLFGQTVSPKEESKNTAVNRLRLVLMQDRTNLTPEIMHKMRSELIGVLSKYVELDKEALELNFEQEGEQMALMLSIPVIRAKDEAEIEQALKEESKSDSDEDLEDESEENENSDDSDAESEISEDEDKNSVDDEDTDKDDDDEEEEEIDEDITETDSSQKDKESVKQDKTEKKD